MYILKIIFTLLLLFVSLNGADSNLISDDLISIDSLKTNKIELIYQVSTSGFIIDIAGTALSTVGYFALFSSNDVTQENFAIASISCGATLRGIGTLMNNCAASAARDKYTENYNLKSNRTHWGMLILTGGTVITSAVVGMASLFQGDFLSNEVSPLFIGCLVLFVAKDIPWSISNILAYKVTRRIKYEYKDINIHLNPEYKNGMPGLSLQLIF
jgi:hypothetical protein